MHPIVIIGSGMAAYAVAREFRKLDQDAALMMICADDARNYAKPTLSNALVGNKAPAQIALGDAEKMSAQLNMQILNHTWVKKIDAATHTLSLEQDGETTEQAYSKLILALGATPIRLALNGNAAEQLHVVNNLNDYTAFRAELDQKTAQRVAILGAGLIGCEFANDLQHSGHQATVIDLAQQPLARLLPSDVAQAFQDKLQQAGIGFALGTTVTAINKDADAYQVSLANGETLVADVVLSAIGLRANTELAQAAGIATNRGVVTNTQLETNVADIYAVGDCAEVNGTLLPYVMPIMQQARALAKTLSGNTTAVHYPAMPVAVKTPAAPLTVLPVPHEVNVSWHLEAQEDGLIAKAVDAEETLRGFVLLGATAGKQRLSLTKLVPDLIPAAL
jgi:rubredoxin---NAD+ reductase